MPDRRNISVVKPKVLTISSQQPDRGMRFAQPGTVAMLIAGAEGAAHLDAIAEAVESENFEEVERLHVESTTLIAKTLLTADKQALADQHERTHATFVHGRSHVVLGMFTPSGVPVAHSLALLDGETADPEDYVVAVSRFDGTEDPVTALVVAWEPQFTPLEREVSLRVPELVGRAGALELGYWVEGIAARFAVDLTERAIEFAAEELGVTDQIHAVQDLVGQVEHAAADIVGAALHAADGVIHGLAEAAGIDGIIQAGEDAVLAVAHVVNAIDNAFNAVVDAGAEVVADAVGVVVQAAEHVVVEAAVEVGHAAEAVGNAVGDAVVGAADAVADVVGAVVDFVADIFGGTDELRGSLELKEQFELAAAAQLTFRTVFEEQLQLNLTRIETVRPAASLGELIHARSQLVRASRVRRPALSLVLRKR